MYTRIIKGTDSAAEELRLFEPVWQTRWPEIIFETRDHGFNALHNL